MSKLEYAAKRLKEYKAGIGAVNEYDVIRAIVGVCKEEIPEWTFSAKIMEPELIQGYTAENWQEIIDGGYLCEFSDQQGVKYTKRFLEEIIDQKNFIFKDDVGAVWRHCRPAQIKGVMRPIFVEPVGKDAGYVFFDRRGSYLGTSNFFTGATWNETIGCCMSSDCTPTKYIEL